MKLGYYGDDGLPNGPVDLLVPEGYVLQTRGDVIAADALMYNGRSELDEERWKPSDLVGETLSPGMRLRAVPIAH